MQLDQLTTTKISLSQDGVFGPTIQGEGPWIGRACYFLRLQHCPVKCEGCDTHYTWDGSEEASTTSYDWLLDWAERTTMLYPKVGLVVSGGEPLIHYKNENVSWLMSQLSMHFDWMSLETSGFVGDVDATPAPLLTFLSKFDNISYSPKITPCLRGPWSPAQMLRNSELILQVRQLQVPVTLKFVVKTDEDVEVVKKFDDANGWSEQKIPIQLMPYGQEPDEIIEACKWLIQHAVATGYTITPRLHSIMYGKQRKV